MMQIWILDDFAAVHDADGAIINYETLWNGNSFRYQSGNLITILLSYDGCSDMNSSAEQIMLK